MKGLSPAESSDDCERQIEGLADKFLAELQAGRSADMAATLAAHPELAERLKPRLALVERLFRAGQRAARAVPNSDGKLPADRAHRLKCPHCGNGIQLVEPRPREVTCLNCGSSFAVDPEATASFRGIGPGSAIGRFQILELLGRGAFGEVYKAHDPQLDRTVAVKIPRVEYFSTPEEEQRFLREARSAAGLRRSGIVQVYEIAQLGNLSYIVSEYIEGITLADLISGGSPGSRESAELIAQLADALDYAHRQKVVHRDVKPSNILLASAVNEKNVIGGSAQFVPYLTDFGLARRDEGEITVTMEGQVVGTPAYMSPEQACGDHRKVDGRSDVYSLGVVLYELISGELPFRGSRRMLLHQVLYDEPRSPRLLNDRIPRDLETVCLKAMAKEPSRRYATAAEFADDLRRFLCGDAIRARPTGRWERAWRWCRRNPMVSGLSAAVAISLMAGTVVSAYFEMQAEQRAKGERQARNETEGVLTRGLVRQLSPDADVKHTLNYQEGEALWELASLGSESVWLRALDEGTRNPLLAARLRSRSEPAMIALVGLNESRKNQAAQLLQTRIEDRSLPLEQRVDIALLALELGDRPESLIAVCRVAFQEAIEHSAEAENWHRWGTHVADSADRLDSDSVIPMLVSCLKHAELGEARDRMTAGLVTLGLRKPAAEGARLLMAQLVAEKECDVLQKLAEEIAALGARLPLRSRESLCGRAAARLNDVRTRETKDSNLLSLNIGLTALIPGLKADEADRVAFELGGQLRDWVINDAKANEAAEAAPLTEALVSAIGQLSPADAARIAESTTGILIDALRRETAPYLKQGPAQRIVQLTKPLGDAEAARLCMEPARLVAEAGLRVADSMEKSNHFDLLGAKLWFTLPELTARMPRAEAARVCTPLAERLLELLKQWKSLGASAGPVDQSDVIHMQLRGLCAVAAQIDPIKRVQITQEALRVVIHLISLETNAGSLAVQTRKLVESMVGIDPAAANPAALEAAAILKEALTRSADPKDRANLIYDLAELAQQVFGPDALPFQREAALLLAEAMVDEADPQMLLQFSFVLAELAANFERAESERICAEPFQVVRQSYRNAAENGDLDRWPDGVSWLAAQIPPADAIQALAEVILDRGSSDYTPAKALAAIAGQLGPTEGQKALEPILMKLLGRRFGLDVSFQAGPGFGNHAGSAMARLTRSHPLNRSERVLAETSLLPLLWALDEINPRRAHEFAVALAKASSAWADEDSPEAMMMMAFDFTGYGHAFDRRQRSYCYDDRSSNLDDILSKRDGPPRMRGIRFESAGEYLPGRPSRLNVADLVELLKMPTCFGAARRVVLAHLERHYTATFENHWAFVRFVKERGLQLDFQSGARRPEPVALWNDLRSNRLPAAN